MKKRFGKLLGSQLSGTRSERRRKLGLESLEGRRLLASDLLFHNHLIAEDANRDFSVTPLDALIVVNEINRGGMRPLGDSEGESPAGNSGLLKFDTSGDNYLSALDILLVVNRLNAEGENDALMGFTYQITDLQGTPIAPNSITVGQQFRVNALVQDLRPTSEATGVFSASLDLGVSNLELVEFEPANPSNARVQFGELFAFFPDGGEGGGLQINGEPSVAEVSDGQQFSLDSVVFEFDWDGALAAGSVPVTVPNPGSGSLSFTQVGNALVTAINGSSLGVTASINGQGVVGLPPELEAGFDALTSQLTWSDVEQEYFNEITATTNPLLLSGPIGPTQFFSAEFTALEQGTVTFTPTHKEFVFNENLLFGSTDRLPNNLVMVGDPFTVTIQADPTAPVAVADSVSTNEDTALTLVASTLLANDTVTAPRTLSLVSIDPVASTQGSLSGSTYTPPANFFGQDLLSYTIEDSTGLRSTGTITITVNAVNDAPVAVNDSFVVVEDSVDEPLNGLLSNDNGGPGEPNDVLRITAVGTPNNGGTVRIAPSGIGLIYTPAAEFIGTETFTYTVSDQGNLTATATVTVEVEPLTIPRARLDQATVAEDSSDGVIDVLANDRVNEGEQAVLLSVTQPTNGSVEIGDNGTPDDQTDDTVLYTPNANFFGTDTFTYVMNDTLDPPGENSIGTVTVTVTNVNDPVELSDDTRTATEDTVATYSVASLLANDSPGVGEATIQSLTITSVAAVGAGGSVVLINGNVVYTPAPDFNGTFRFTYTAQDDGTPVSSATATVTVTVAAVNDNPVAVADSVTTPEDSVLTIPVATLLANDNAGAANESSQVLSVTAVSPTSANGGTVALSGDSVTYTPAANFFGTDSFTYTLSDGAGGTATGTVNVTVTAVNDPPVIVRPTEVVAFADLPTIIEASTILANVLPGPANEVQNLRIVSVSSTANTNGSVVLNADGTITYTPAAGFTGPAIFEYVVEDVLPGGVAGARSTGTVNVTVQEFVPSIISGVIWVDETNDGIMDARERRLGGVEVHLTGTSLGEPVNEMVKTLADGSYDFPGLAPGQYTVTYVSPMFMLESSVVAKTHSVTIVEPGGVSDADNHFAVRGLDVSYSRRIDQQAANHYLRDNSLFHNGAFFALDTQGNLQWGANLGGYSDYNFSEAAMDGGDLLLTLVSRSTLNVETARLEIGDFFTTRDSQNNTLVRVLGGRDHFQDWQSVDLSSPPVTSPNSRYLDAVDEIFDQEGW